MTDIDPMSILWPLLRLLSTGDLSTLEAICHCSPDQLGLMTSPGSENDRLWSAFADLGWATREQIVKRYEDATIDLVQFTVVPERHDKICACFREFVKRNDENAVKLSEGYNRIRVEVPPILLDAVGDYGDVYDLAMMLVAAIDGAAKSYLRSEDNEKFLNIVHDRARAMVLPKAPEQ